MNMMKGSRNVKGVDEWSKAGTFLRKPENGWLHSAQNIKDGVCYALKYLGCIEVLKSMRTLKCDVRQQVTKSRNDSELKLLHSMFKHVSSHCSKMGFTKGGLQIITGDCPMPTTVELMSRVAVADPGEAMYRCCEANGYKFTRRKKAKSNILKLLADYPRTAHSDTFISLTVSMSGILLTDMSSGQVISKHDIQGISFTSGAEKDIPDIVGYVAKDALNRRACHVLDCPQNLSFDVVTTIGQAFELHYKMFLENPPEILPVPGRFEGSIFGDEEQQAVARFELSDRTYANDQEDELENTYEEPDVKHEYCTPSAAPRPSLLDEDTEHYQAPRPTPSYEMPNYDNPRGTLETHPRGEKTTSTDLTFRTQFESALTQPPVNVPSHDALASGPENDEDLLISFDSFDSPASTGQVSNGASFKVNWETFDDEVTTSSDLAQPAAERPTPMPRKSLLEPAIQERADSPQHNSLGYALPFYKKPEEQVTKRTPPPLPKPYASKSTNNSGTPPPEPIWSVEPASSADSGNEMFLKEWFHGLMSRQDAENLLVRDGDFLVRESTTNPGQYVLTGLQNGYPKHLLLVDPAGVVRTKNHSFQSVDHLVRFHRDNNVPIISSGSVIQLRQPIVRNSQPYEMPLNVA